MNIEYGDLVEDGFVQVKTKLQQKGKKVQLIKTTRIEVWQVDVHRGRDQKVVTRVGEASSRPNP